MVYISRTRDPAFYFNASPETILLAKRLRNYMTACEKILWDRLRRKNIRGVKFRRQHPISFYIADFYCHEARLVIEVDGQIHKRRKHIDHDKNRTAEMDRYDIKVIRVTNEEIKYHVVNVMQKIRREIQERLKSLK